MIDAKELDIPYDMIIGRNSIIEHSLLLYDPDFHTLGMRLRHDDDSMHDIAHNPAVGSVTPTVRGDTNDGINQGAVAKQPDETFVGYLHEVHRLFMLLEGEKMRHYTCPADSTEELLTLSSGIAMPTAKLSIQREPKNGISGVPVDQDGKTSSLPGDDSYVNGFNRNQKWHSTKPDRPELNRAHKDAYIHYEASAEGMDFASAWEPQYQGMIRSDPTPTGTLVGRNASNGVHTEYYLLPTMLGDEELREETGRLCTKYQTLFSISVSPEPADLKPMELVVDQNK
jgi:hypothetical protein